MWTYLGKRLPTEHWAWRSRSGDSPLPLVDPLPMLTHCLWFRSPVLGRPPCPCPLSLLGPVH